MASLALRRPWLALSALFLFTPAIASGQQARPSRLAIDTAASIDESVDENGNYATRVFLDAVVSVGIGRGLEAIVWPIAQRRSANSWEGEVWIAALRYERQGPVGIRIDGGLIPAPVGLANLIDRRPHLNPLISQPASLFTPLPSLELRSPRLGLLGPIYPLGGQVTVSGPHWDARGAVMNTSPVRTNIFGSEPANHTNVVFGAGITPVVGFRVGTSVTRGNWANAGETPTTPADRDATVFTVESEFSMAYTKLAGEWVRDVIETGTGDRVASGWFVQGQQTLAPRWFVAGRLERISSPLVLPAVVTRQHMTGSEEVLGYRATPEITVRIGHRARRGFGRPGFDHLGEVSLVWWRRWI